MLLQNIPDCLIQKAHCMICTRNTKQQKNSNTTCSHVARVRTEKSSGKQAKPPEASFCDLLTQLEIALA
jgi:hypothetical protein